MGYHPRIESAELASFLTTRSQNARLWFVNNRELERAVLGYAARCAERYSVKLYALAIEGNHIQGPAHFPNENRAEFMRDFNSTVARAVPVHTPEYEGGRFWARRYSSEFLPAAEDIEERFFYTVLQPVQDGLVEKISDYPGYNCFHDAVWGIAREFKVVKWGEYNAARRYNPKVSIKDYTSIVTLRYERIPGYEHLNQKEYADLMHKKLEERRAAIVKERLKEGKGFEGRARMLAKKRGTFPVSSKTATRFSRRPRVLSKSKDRRESCKKWYFSVFAAYKAASRAFRLGQHDVKFPEGTYKPYCSSRPPAYASKT